MNQAGSENKCSKRVSIECILNKNNFDDVSTDQNSKCENCKQRGLSLFGKHSCHLGTASNTEHVVDRAEVSQQQQTGTNNSCHKSLLQKAWVYLQSVITTHMTGCPRCNPNPPPSTSVVSPSQSSIVSFLSSTSSQSRSSTPTPSKLSCQQSCLSCVTSCHRGRCPSQARLSCPRASSPCCHATPSCARAIHSIPRPTPPCPSIKPRSTKAKKTYPTPNAKPSSAIAKQTFHAKPTSPDAKPTYPHAKPSCLNAKCPNPKCPNAKPSCKNLQPPCPYAIPPCPNAKCPSAEPSCPSLQPPCPHAEPLYPNALQVCPYAKPPCPNAKSPNAKPSCPSLQSPCSKAKLSNPNFQPPSLCGKPLCPNSKTSLYYSFSNDSLSSICKESLVELAKVNIKKLTSDHKVRCPRCSKRLTNANSKETISSYLRSVVDQAWSYFNMRTEQNISQPQRVLSIYSNTSTSPKNSESPSPTKSRCCCAGSLSKSPKTQSCEAICCPKPVFSPKSVTIPKSVACPTCLAPATCSKPDTCPRPVSCPTCLKTATCSKPATCPKFCKCEGATSPTQRSKAEGTHEHKYCYTPCCMHNSQGVQHSYIMSEKSCWSPQTSMNPLYIRSHQIKTPQSVEELKASITGLTCLDKSRNMPYVQDLKVSKDSTYSTDIPPPKLGISLNVEQKDHTFGSHPKECKNSNESLDNCEETKNCCNDLEEQSCKEEAPYSSSGGRAKCDEALLDKDFGSKSREQVHSKEKICKSSHNSVTCVDSNHPDLKDCNAPEKDKHRKDAYRKDPYNYRYYY